MGSVSFPIIGSGPDLQYHVVFPPVEYASNPVRKQLVTFIIFMPLLHSWAYLASLVIITVQRVCSWAKILTTFS